MSKHIFIVSFQSKQDNSFLNQDKIKQDENGQMWKTASAWLWAKISSIGHSIGKNVFVQTKINRLSFSFLVKFDACFLNFTFQVALVLNWSLMQRLMMSTVQGA